MANSILGNSVSGGNQTVMQPQMPTSQPMQMLQQFRQFRQQMAGQNPQQVINRLMQSGQMTPEQHNSLMQQAQQMLPMFRR